MSITSDLISSIPYRMEQIPSEIEPFVEWLCKRNPPIVNVLEIGVRFGGTCALWYEISVGKVIGVDWDFADSLGAEETLRLSLEMETLYDRYTFINGDSHLESTKRRVVETLSGEQLDLLFLDGDHSLVGISKDWHMYCGLVKRGGVIAMHDIVDTSTTHNAGQGVYKFWKRLEGKKREFNSHGEWGGIGVVEV